MRLFPLFLCRLRRGVRFNCILCASVCVALPPSLSLFLSVYVCVCVGKLHVICHEAHLHSPFAIRLSHINERLPRVEWVPFGAVDRNVDCALVHGHYQHYII